jgi:reductive dehalogenase
LIKEVVTAVGACEVGVAKLNPMHVYSHVGRGPENWGEPIENTHKYAVVFTLEMDYDQVSEAPRLGITEESAFQYLRGAQISIALARYIRGLGYPARAHISGSNYQIMLPPVAHDAGLGELGRIGYLMSPNFGPRIRLGAITTDMPLVPDKPVSFGVQDFCTKCLKCAANCPSGAISDGDKTSVRNVEKWQLDIEKCIHYWRAIGTDCGLCMKVCPYSHPPTLIHNLVRQGIRRSSIARTLSVWADDLFYGRKNRT